MEKEGRKKGKVSEKAGEVKAFLAAREHMRWPTIGMAWHFAVHTVKLKHHQLPKTGRYV